MFHLIVFIVRFTALHILYVSLNCMHCMFHGIGYIVCFTELDTLYLSYNTLKFANFIFHKILKHFTDVINQL